MASKNGMAKTEQILKEARCDRSSATTDDQMEIFAEFAGGRARSNTRSRAGHGRKSSSRRDTASARSGPGDMARGAATQRRDRRGCARRRLIPACSSTHRN
ncbi:hypothetical protein BDA96_04G263800 [Sorghum bicolor]|uniref:Uncharacterized protein n=2 Tax=Sorghum bicolor TaxID=4558 RepID=A0A921UKB4_SORBI|nr:hypothetical protein BDA96_04G263800 [Sorghum bicolor]OQU85455.1 hypothetical protein SORBI_3004G247650 [Sorghum bicolor]